jgi:hypothetical protein
MPAGQYDQGGTTEGGGGSGAWLPTTTTTTVEEPGSITDSSCVQINAPELFGGEEREGGIVGTMCVMMGEPTQVPLQALVDMHAASGIPVPGFRGVTTVFYDGKVCANNPYPKVWKFRIRRILKGWDRDPVPWESLAIILLGSGAVDAKTYDQIWAMNPAHMIYECATNKAWGRGLDDVFIDEDSFGVAAQTLRNECFGLCLAWRRQEDLGAFVQQILDHCGGATYINRINGKLTLKLIRNDYDVSTLPVFTHQSGLLSIEEDTGTSSTGLVNEVVVWWKDPITNKKRSARVQNIAGMQSAKAVHSVTKQYPGIPTMNLALRVAQRDLLAQGTPIKRFIVRLDRRAWWLHPASVIRVQDPYRGINDIVLRVGKIVDGEADDGSFTLTCLQDVFGMPATSFVSPQIGGYTPPQTAPVVPSKYRAVEAPYIDIYRTLGAVEAPLVDEASGFVEMMCKKPNDLTTGFHLFTKVGAEVYTDKANSLPTAHANLTYHMGGGISTIQLTGFTEWSRLVYNTPVVIDNEVCRMNSYDSEAETLAVSRGCADTIPAIHLVGADVWFPRTGQCADTTEYYFEEVVSAKPCPTTSTGTLDVSLAPTATVEITSRQFRPYPPGNVMVNGVRFDGVTVPINSTAEDLVFTWATRNRITQGDTLVPHVSESITPEVGQSTVLEFKVGGVIVRTVTDPPGDTFAYTGAMRAEDGVSNECEVVLSSERDGYRSMQSYSMMFFFPYGLGWRLGEYLGGLIA